MARLKTARAIKWAGVEFQPDLLNLSKPIRLGAILLETNAASRAIAVIGRMPHRDSRPPQFQDVGNITMNLVANWVDSMFKDILEGNGENVFDLLARRWRFNLYIIEPKMLRSSEIQGSLETIAKKSYERFVGQPFKTKLVPPDRSGRFPIPSSIPPAWQLEALNQQSMTLGY